MFFSVDTYDDTEDQLIGNEWSLMIDFALEDVLGDGAPGEGGGAEKQARGEHELLHDARG